MGRAPCCDSSTVKKGPWSPKEDEMLKAYIEQNGTGGNWIALPHKIGLKRCGKSCRLRWLNYLRPNIKHGEFSEEEDRIICNLYISIGSRWSIIAAQLPGRTDNDIKNYWNTKLKKKLLGKQSWLPLPAPTAKNNQELFTVDHMNRSRSLQLDTLTPSALERIQLHLQLQGSSSPVFNNPMLLPNQQPLNDFVTTTTSAVAAASLPVYEPSSSCGNVAATVCTSALHSSTSSTNDDCENLKLVEAELRELLYGERGFCFDDHIVNPGDGIKEEERVMNWWDGTIANEEQSALLSAWNASADSMLQELCSTI